MNDQDSNMAANAICHAAEMSRENLRWAAEVITNEWTRPSTLMRPKVYPDGNQWCVLYGDNLQEGVAGFGDSPELAMADFDKNWRTPMAAQGASNE